METLPEEMVSEVTQHLSNRELAACCAVSRAWRDVFNRDVFWRQRCDPTLAHHLRDLECVVEPGFENPKVKGSGLSPACEGRLGCMRQAHLHNNWRRGRYKTFHLPNAVTSMTFYNNNLLITHHFDKKLYTNVVILWDVKCDPIPLSEYLTAHCRELEVYEEFIVLKSKGLVQVLTVSNLKFNFRHSFLISEAERLDGLSDLENVDHERFRLCKTVTIGPTIVAISGWSDTARKLNLWNLKTGEKLKEENYQNLEYLYRKHHCDANKVAIGVKRSKFFKKIVVYDVGRLSFTDFSATFSSLCSYVAVHKEHVAASTSRHINIYILATSQLIRSIPHQDGHCDIHIFGDNFVFCDAGNMKLINPSSVEEKQLVEGVFYIAQVASQSILLFKSSKWYFLTSQHCTSFLPVKLQSLPCMFDLPYKIHSINNMNTKVVYQIIKPNIQKYIVLNFW